MTTLHNEIQKYLDHSERVHCNSSNLDIKQQYASYMLASVTDYALAYDDITAIDYVRLRHDVAIAKMMLDLKMIIKAVASHPVSVNTDAYDTAANRLNLFVDRQQARADYTAKNPEAEVIEKKSWLKRVFGK